MYSSLLFLLPFGKCEYACMCVYLEDIHTCVWPGRELGSWPRIYFRMVSISAFVPSTLVEIICSGSRREEKKSRRRKDWRSCLLYKLDNVAQIVAYYLFSFIAPASQNLCLYWVFMAFYFSGNLFALRQKLVGIFQLLIRHAWNWAKFCETFFWVRNIWAYVWPRFAQLFHWNSSAEKDPKPKWRSHTVNLS